MNLHSVVAVLLVLGAASQAPTVRFDPVFDNSKVSVFTLNLPPGRRAHVFQNTHDILWIALADGQVTLYGHDQQATPVSFRSGDARFVPSFHANAIANDGLDPFRAVLVQIKPRGLASSCDCDSAAQQAVCGCDPAPSLPPMWAVGIGSLVLGGTTLAPGESFERRSERGDLLLVAITPLALVDEASRASSIHLRPGEARWLESGAHKFRNTGSAPARYVTLEF